MKNMPTNSKGLMNSLSSIDDAMTAITGHTVVVMVATPADKCLNAYSHNSHAIAFPKTEL